MLKLPEKLSDLIDLALDDLEKCENDPKYNIDMGHWYTVTNDGCNVCLAGSVIAQEVPVEQLRLWEWWGNELHPTALPLDLRDACLKLNYAREGNWMGALDWLNLRPLSFVHKLPMVPDYADDPAEFKLALSQASDILRQNGY